MNIPTDMNSLIDKYGKDELTPEELSELKKYAGATTDAEIGQQLHDVWFDDDMDTSSVDDALMNKIKDKIDVATRRSGLSLFIRRTQIAAAILLPIFIVFTIWLYRENRLITSEEMFVTTGRSERASITLPDGTVVSLNTESKLGYIPKDYNKKERKINFSGEGYFQVRNDRNIPFFVNAKGLQIKVLGTIFNLSVRENSRTAELSLEEGSVMLSSVLSNRSVVMRKNQKAILEYKTGNITVISDENISDKSAWRRGDMIFRNTELSQVIRTIEKNYSITVKIECEQCLTDTFTGVLPVDDLNEVFEVIERAYHLKSVLRNRIIVLYCETY
ncbi:MAG: FecR domain-containing protein [Dysgonamonadaceae bacterium]|jgi:ferric-dicitrate binding protein FerR (iron transport regulator)|nr:FecR domain-containing protein [Dysgonamonadaceae bacterium]